MSGYLNLEIVAEDYLKNNSKSQKKYLLHTEPDQVIQ
jgi:hypothetical protein